MNMHFNILLFMGPERSAADVKKEIPVLVQSLMSTTLSSTSFQSDNTFWGGMSDALEQSRCKDNMIARGTQNSARG